MRTGIANLPLHYGSAPSWLFEKMVHLSHEILSVIVSESTIDDFLFKISNPYWFQAFGCVLGFDWHSSGLTTTVCGALKEAIKGQEKDFGLYICGGKGKTSRKTPEEILNFGEKLGQDLNYLVYASKMAAKVDNTAVQDGYQLYHHTFFFTKNGKWSVVQQGMSLDRFDKLTTGTLGIKSGWARRYHWLSDNVFDFVSEPHTGIACDHKGITLNMVAKDSDECRNVSAILACEKPKKLIKYAKGLEKIKLPKEHQIFAKNLNSKYLAKIFLTTYENQPKNYEQLLGIGGVGPKTIRALALISDLVYGTPPSWKDPARFSFAHGGKDGIPYPVDKKTYEKSIEFLKIAVSKAKIGDKEKIRAFRQLVMFY